jgi:hypothetical protein
MSTATVAPASTVGATPAPVVDLDTRLAIADAAMTVRLEHAQLAFEVNTAHLPTPAVDYVAPILPTLEPTPAPAVSPLAAVYLGAIQILQERGWTRGHLREGSAVCAVGAIQAAAGPANRPLADDACAHLLDVIQVEFADAPTVPSWNDQQTSVAPVIRILGTAAQQA